MAEASRRGLALATLPCLMMLMLSAMC